MSYTETPVELELHLMVDNSLGKGIVLVQNNW